MLLIIAVIVEARTVNPPCILNRRTTIMDLKNNLTRKLSSGHVIPKTPDASRTSILPNFLKKHALAFGPRPKKSLETFVDLGLSDQEIARYFNVPQTCVSKLRLIWKIPNGTQRTATSLRANLKQSAPERALSGYRLIFEW